MKNNINKIIMILILFTGVSCTELDLVPLDAPTTAPFTSKQQFREGLNETYREAYFPIDESSNGVDDDMNYRYVLDPIKAGTVAAENGTVRARWSTMYTGIARILSIKNQILTQEGVLSEIDAKTFLAEANFALANYWSYLITHFGDAPYYEKQLSVDETFEMSRTDKGVILAKIYEFYDNAISNLPTARTGLQYATKGAALAMKARTAMIMGDYNIASEASKGCMDLGIYELHPNFADLFLTNTRKSKELIFYFPRSDGKNVLQPRDEIYYTPRNVGGYGGVSPTWELLASFECIDGKPIDESPLFDPQNPFKNRDPRCSATIVPFGSLKDGDGLLPTDGSRWLDREYTPHPERTTVLNYATNSQVKNNDAKTGTPWSSFTGLLFKKNIDEEWLDGRSDGNRIIMRYADVLLMYAEAKIELDQIDASVLKAINDVRDRAYAGSGFSNPTVTTTNQAELRYVVRNERRVELAFEGLRYMDIIRWRIAHKVLSGHHIGLVADGSLFTDIKGKITVKPNLWFWGLIPEIDEDGHANFDPLVAAGFASNLAEINFPERQYLWPVPMEEILLAPNLLPNNPGY